MRLKAEESVKVGVRRENALCRSKWGVGVSKIAVEVNLATLICCGYYQILDIGVSCMSLFNFIFMPYVCRKCEVQL